MTPRRAEIAPGAIPVPGTPGARLGTRAVVLMSNNRHFCEGCTDVIGGRGLSVCANVYVDGKWDRLEWWHGDCYAAAGSPHGQAEPYQRPAAGAGNVFTKLRVCHFCGAEYFGSKAGRRARCARCKAAKGAA